ncbi:MAG: B12-binding domain-containing radical SAM protein, partial [Dehalococcoidia bacterium]
MGRPARYTGGEWNAVVKDWAGAQVRLVLVYPDVYEVGATSLGLATLYQLLNERPEALAERAYVPWVDMEQEMRRVGLPLFSLESRHALGDFDIICLSLSYELTYTNVLTVLELAGLRLAAAERQAP